MKKHVFAQHYISYMGCIEHLLPYFLSPSLYTLFIPSSHCYKH